MVAPAVILQRPTAPHAHESRYTIISPVTTHKKALS
jgi:hypothetical protein